ncbi:MAG: hypothetical protein WBC87_04010, partial [Pseudolabrys sp.]
FSRSTYCNGAPKRKWIIPDIIVRDVVSHGISQPRCHVCFVPIATLDKIPAARRPPHMRFGSMQLRDVFESAL